MALARRQSTLRPRANRSWPLGNAESLGGVFSDFDRLFSELSSSAYSGAQWAQAYPADLYETDESLVLEMAVPGVNVGDLDISIEGRQLSIRGSLPEDDSEGRRYWVKSIPQGQFSRTVTLPTNVELESIDARVDNGLLRLTMPKVPEAKARRIEIQQG